MTRKIKHSLVYALLLTLCELMVVLPVRAQEAGDSFGLRIVASQAGDGSTTVRQLSARPPSVIVEDRSNRPVANAIVVFTAPESGASGVFEDGSRTLTVTTDRTGRAVGLGYRANATTGPYQIQVRAQFLNETAESFIGHTNIATRGGSGKLIGILAAVGGVAIGAVVAGGGGGGGNNSSPNSTPPATPPTITFGGSSIGAPGR